MRLRVRFTKLGKVRFTSHRDVARIWERALRRAALPVAYTEGFSPRPRLSFGLALSTGHESLGEYLDAELALDPGAVELDALPGRLSPCLPVGIDVVAAAALAPGTPSLQADVTSCTWAIELDGVSPLVAAEAVTRALDAPALVATARRKGGEVLADLRPGIHELAVESGAATPLLHARLAAQPHSVRPSDLVAAILPGSGERRVVRTHQWIETDGARREPLEAPDATSLARMPTVCA